MQENKNARSAAIATILEIWSSIDWDKVDSKRAINIWDEVSAKVKAAALTTNKFEKFIDKLCRKLDVRSLRFREINDIVHEPEEFKQAILKLFREETLSIMLEVRLNNQVRKEQAQQEKERRKAIDELNNKLDKTEVIFTEKGVETYEN